MKSIFQIPLIVLLLIGNQEDVKRISSFKTTRVVMDTAPEFFVLEWKEGMRLTERETEFFIQVDSMGRQEVVALLDEKETPFLYTSDISTPVCADGDCKLMNIKLYWTLLGEYAGFDRYPGLPLTKHDHDEFKIEDYQKLHALLTDDKSILGRRSVDQLVEKPKMRSVNGVDAVSGATIARVKESVVSGALYSCYTAWHLVHGEIREQLKAFSLTVLNEAMTINMLYSVNDDYQLFALGKIGSPKYKQHYKQIAKVFETSTPLVRSIIAKRLVSKYKDAPDLQKPFWDAFDTVDSGSRSLMINCLGDAPDYVPYILSKKLSAMSKNQLKRYLKHLNRKEEMNPKVKNNIAAFANLDYQTYAYLAKEFLDGKK
ncbi:hypothetical protein [Flagellimonas algicola]|uniref:HEAT repeat protein n=1 Tax=Flagellimonas algicola TaxID=2583815 RepID=A0ABY2WRP8_9FLAO|nr:hypothetical protein [Allomuricauda algicola]TMU57341.1 hypothetical protein FGG15_07300 [Allomuricauda algicola]